MFSSVTSVSIKRPYQMTSTSSWNLSNVFYVAIFLFILTSLSCEGARRPRNLFQKINRDPDLSSFGNLLKTNRIARVNLNYEAVTAFVPENEAFEHFNGVYDQHLTYYHMSYEVKTLQQLALSQKVSSVGMSLPPLWVGRRGNDLYINNAMIVKDKSDNLGKTADKIQMLHVLDEVLDPIIRNSSIDPTAYQLMATPDQWQITETIEMFFEKVRENGLQEMYQSEGAHTFFIPIDKNIDDHRYNHLDNYTIQSHVVLNQVIFTRPANKVFFYETACNGDYIYVLASFIERADKIFAKSTTVLGDSDHPKGEVLAEIITPNIPVKNGVVHIIARPVVIFDRKLKPFPYLSVYYKVSSDPYLEFAYDIGENTGVNNMLNQLASDKKVTYFVPRNQAWKKAFEERSYTIDEQTDILSRHIVVDSTALSMDRLLYLSTSSYNGSFMLNTLGGEEIMLNVLFAGDSYFINFNDTFIRVYRANYMCDDGIVHVLDDSPFLYQQERLANELPPVEANAEDVDTTEESHGAAFDFYSYLKGLIT